MNHDEEVLCRGWTRSSIERLVESATDAERTVLETFARKMMATRSDVASALGPGSTEKTVDGLLGNLGKRAKKLAVTDETGLVSWPFFINPDPATGTALYLMPKQVADVIVPGSRAGAKPWEL